MKVALPASVVGKIWRSYEHLRNDMIVLCKELVINIHQFALTYRCCGLLCRHVFGALGQAQLPNTHAYRT